MSSKILLIDDDDLVVRTINALLSKKGYYVETAKNAVDAVSKAAVSDFDLVISDIRMPGENGIIAIEKIKKIYEKRKVICGYIFISGYAEEDTPAHAIRLGVDKFLYKPFDNKKLLESISEEIELCEQKANLTKASKSQIVKRPPKTPEAIKANRVVITGIGCVAPSGIGRKAYWDGLKEGRNCVDRISSFDSSPFPSKASSEIRNFDSHRKRGQAVGWRTGPKGPRGLSDFHAEMADFEWFCTR